MRGSLLRPLVISLLLTSSSVAFCQQMITGKDWLSMGDQEKITYIFTAMEIFSKHDVPLRQLPNQYMALIDAELEKNPAALEEDPTNILASVVCENEPAAREAIDRIRK